MNTNLRVEPEIANLPAMNEEEMERLWWQTVETNFPGLIDLLGRHYIHHNFARNHLTPPPATLLAENPEIAPKRGAKRKNHSD